MDTINLNREMINAAQIVETVAGALLAQGYADQNAMKGAANAANVWLNDEGLQGVLVTGSRRGGVAEYRLQVTYQEGFEWLVAGGLNFAIDINAGTISRPRMFHAS